MKFDGRTLVHTSLETIRILAVRRLRRGQTASPESLGEAQAAASSSANVARSIEKPWLVRAFRAFPAR